jgi:hypothetical protein
MAAGWNSSARNRGALGWLWSVGYEWQ